MEARQLIRKLKPKPTTALCPRPFSGLPLDAALAESRRDVLFCNGKSVQRQEAAMLANALPTRTMSPSFQERDITFL